MCSSCKATSSEDVKDGTDCSNLQLVPVGGPQWADSNNNNDNKQLVRKGCRQLRRCYKERDSTRRALHPTRLGKVQYCNLIIGQIWDESLIDGILFAEEFKDNELVYLKNENKMEPKQISAYQSFIAEELQSYNTNRLLPSASQIEGCAHILGGMDDRTMSISPMLDCRLEADYLIAKHDKDVEIITRSTDSTDEVHLLSIPFHILETIMENCFGVEYMNFRATCKRCYLAAPLTRWQTYSPWFMVLNTYPGGNITFIDPICGDKYFMKTPQELNGDCEVLCSRFGWLMFDVNGHGLLLFFNPFTSNIYKLPKAPYYFESLCFSAPPTSPDCMVVGFTSHIVCVHFVSQEASSWRTYRFGGPSDCFRFPAFCGRDIWALCNNDEILNLRDTGEGYSLDVVTDKVPRGCGSHIEYFMSKCGEHLLLIIVNDLGESVEVLKLNESTKEWEKIDDLGKHMICISESEGSCICLEAKAPQMGNKIFFPRLLQSKDTKIVFYSLETRKLHTFDDKHIQESFGFDLSRTYGYCFPNTWIEPNCS
ncbi:F-box/kelch-repeat protein At1g57790-like [Bidens hawaiensis]|uniref:F-box/kelch-repeat protein At1g57790-like n=1 Tax=Bidens hawaiensis TaxID=980011 RepID=UPI00404A177B